MEIITNTANVWVESNLQSELRDSGDESLASAFGWQVLGQACCDSRLLCHTLLRSHIHFTISFLIVRNYRVLEKWLSG